jgi:hypothetical protein
MSSHCAHDTILLVAPDNVDVHSHLTMQIAFYMHTVQNKANSIRFTYQYLCSPRISTLPKAIPRGYLKGCPNLTAKGVTKYLNPSPATAKGHMKRPHQGIQSTQQMVSVDGPIKSYLVLLVMALNEDGSYNSNNIVPLHHIMHDNANIIKDDASPRNADVFCFTASAYKHTGTL